MTTAELNNNIDTLLQYFKKDRQIEIKQFLSLVANGFPLQDILSESETRGLLKKVNSLTGDRIYELTEKGEIVLQMGGFVSYLNNDLEMTRLTRKNLSITYWSTIGQFILAFFVAIATCISAYIAWSDFQDKKNKELRQRDTVNPIKEEQVKQTTKPTDSTKTNFDSVSVKNR